MFSLATVTTHKQQLSSKVPLNYIVGQIKTCTSDHSPSVSLWDHIHKENKKHLLLHTSLYEFARRLSNTGDECIGSRLREGPPHSDGTEAAVLCNISVSSRWGPRRDLWKTSPRLSAHLGCHAPDNAAEGPGLPALRSTRTMLNTSVVGKK